MSDLMTGVFMAVVFAPIPLIICAVMGNEAKPKLNIVIGTTLPYAALDDPRVAEISSGFKKAVRRCAVVSTLALFPSFLAPSVSTQMLYLFTWLPVVVVWPMAIYARHCRRMRSLKREAGWTCAPTGRVVLDTAAAERAVRPLSAWWFAPAIATAAVPVILSLALPESLERAGSAAVTGSFLFCCLLGPLFYPAVFRQRPDVLDRDSRVNAALTNVRRGNWGRIWIALTWLSAALSVCMWLWWGNDGLMTTCVLGYTVLLMGYAVYREFVVRREQERISAAAAAEEALTDEDDLWLFGLVYCNPSDRHFFIKDRVGSGMSVNVARAGGKLFMGFALLSILAMPFFGGWLVLAEYTPREAAVADGVCVVEHFTLRYEIPLDEVTSAELLESLPRGSRTNGTGMDSLLEGRFNMAGLGDSRLCLDPREGPFLLLITPEVSYILNLMSPSETEELYKVIRSELSA